MSHTPGGCGQWLTAKDNRTLKPTSQKRSKTTTAEKVLRGISKNSVGLDVKWSWISRTPHTKERIRRTKQTKLDRFLKPSRAELHTARLDDIDSIKNTVKSIALKRRQQPGARLAEGDDDAVSFNLEFKGSERSGFDTEYSNEDSCESKENISHNSRDKDNSTLDSLTGPAAKRLKLEIEATETQNYDEIERRIVLNEDDSPEFRFTQWMKYQVQECQQMQEVAAYTSGSLSSLQQTISRHITPQKKRICEARLPEPHMAKKLTPEVKDTMAQQRCEVQHAIRNMMAMKQSPRLKDSTWEGCVIPEKLCADRSTKGLRSHFSETGITLPTSPVHSTQYLYRSECTQHSESQFHFSEWARNEISDCERLQWEKDSPCSYAMIAHE